MAKDICTVNELIQILQDLSATGHGKDVVLLSSDGEGNSFLPFMSYDDSLAWDNANYEVVDPEECDVPDAVRAVILYPQG